MFLRKSKWMAFVLTICLTAALFAGCGKNSEGNGASDAGESAGQELQEYEAEGVGVFYLPEGFTVESGVSEEGLPMNFAVLTKDSITISASRFGADAYEAAGVPLPADLEEYSQRDGVKQGLPEGAEFEEDDYGNLYVEYVQDGNVYYNVLKQGTESFGAFLLICPEGEKPEDAALWASKMILE